MKRYTGLLAILAFIAGTAGPAFADPDRDESGHGRKGYKGGEYKEEYWDGNCKVERKWEKNGKYKEERKCDGPRRYGDAPQPVHREPGVVVQPPSVVIQPPSIIIK